MNSPTSSPVTPAPAQPKVLTDPSAMTSELRLQAIETYRQRRLAGEELTLDELRHAIACISADRAAAAKERTKSNRAATAAITAPSLEDL